MAKNLSWVRVAVRPKWIGALVGALAVAAICALLGQWQLSRSFSGALSPTPSSSSTAAPAKSLEKFELYISGNNTYIVADRLQLDGTAGFWVIADGREASGKSLTVALGFADNLKAAEDSRTTFMNLIRAQAFLPVEGILEPGEAPAKSPDLSKPYLLASLAPSQLVNLYSPDVSIDSYPEFLILQNWLPAPASTLPLLSEIKIGTSPPKGLDINWLNAFYAIEWTLFAGFAVFLWWRLVEDARLREIAEGKLEQ
jgi:hypothetical protein